MEAKKKKQTSYFRLAYGTPKERRKKGLPGPFFDLAVFGVFVALGLGYLA